MTRSTKESRRAEPQRNRLWQVIAASAVALAFAVTAVVATLPRTDTAIVTLPTDDAAVSALQLVGDPTGFTDPTMPEISTEIQAAIYYPAEWNDTKHPVVFIQHGGHNVCASPTDSWPCVSVEDRTPSFLGYGYLAEALVRQGYVVVSVSANGSIGRAEVSSESALLNEYLSILDVANTQKEELLGQELTGHLDLNSVTLIGHSRGGDAIASVLTGSGQSTQLTVPVVAAVLVAPVLPVDNSDGTEALASADVPVLTLVGTCDGDAGGDGAIYARAFPSPDSGLVTVDGANHNFYNTVWTPRTGVADAVDDAASLGGTEAAGCAPGTPARLSADQQHDALVTAVTRFLSGLGR